MAEFTMPTLGADMEQGLLLEWLVGPGDRVSRGDVVAVVETDKAAIEVECFDSGTVEQLLVQPGTRVPVGTPLAMIAAGTPAGAGGAERVPPGAEAPAGAGGAERVPPDTGGPVLPGAAQTVPSGIGERALPGAGEAVPGEAAAGPGPGQPTAAQTEPGQPATAGPGVPERGTEEAGPGPGASATRRRAARKPDRTRAREQKKRRATGGTPLAAPPPADREPEAHLTAAGPRPGPGTGAAPSPGQPVTAAHAAHAAPAPALAPPPAPPPARPPAAPEPRQPPAPRAPVGAGPLVRHLADVRGVDLAAVHGTGRGGRITRADVEHAPIAPAPPRVRATPYARRVGYALGVDLAALHGTADGGAVRAADVHAAVRAPARTGPERPPRTGPAPARAVSVEERGSAMRRAIGELMSRSKKEVPHYYLSTTIDLAAAQDWLHRRNRGRPPSDRLVPAALLLKAAALAAREVPQLNGFWKDGEFAPGAGVHLGIAVSLRGGGLLAPVIRDADTHAPEELMATLRDLVQRARLGRLRGSEVSGATLTVTSLGEQGVEAVFGVIHPPQVALVGFGAVVERPWATGGLLGVRPVVTATLSADHRASDGAVGARYLTAVGRLLQKPEEL